MHTYRLSFLLEVCHEEGKEDQLGEIHLEIQHQKSVSEFASELASISARWLASSAIALQHLQILQPLEPIPSHQPILSNSLSDSGRFLKVLFPFL